MTDDTESPISVTRPRTKSVGSGVVPKTRFFIIIAALMASIAGLYNQDQIAALVAKATSDICTDKTVAVLPDPVPPMLVRQAPPQPITPLAIDPKPAASPVSPTATASPQTERGPETYQKSSQAPSPPTAHELSQDAPDYPISPDQTVQAPPTNQSVSPLEAASNAVTDFLSGGRDRPPTVAAPPVAPPEAPPVAQESPVANPPNIKNEAPPVALETAPSS